MMMYMTCANVQVGISVMLRALGDWLRVTNVAGRTPQRYAGDWVSAFAAMMLFDGFSSHVYFLNKFEDAAGIATGWTWLAALETLRDTVIHMGNTLTTFHAIMVGEMNSTSATYSSEGDLLTVKVRTRGWCMQPSPCLVGHGDSDKIISCLALTDALRLHAEW